MRKEVKLLKQGDLIFICGNGQSIDPGGLIGFYPYNGFYDVPYARVFLKDVLLVIRDSETEFRLNQVDYHVVFNARTNQILHISPWRIKTLFRSKIITRL